MCGRTPEQRNDWRAAPLLADLAGLPPAQLIVGRLDPLLDDSAAPVTSAAHRIFKYTVA